MEQGAGYARQPLPLPFAPCPLAPCPLAVTQIKVLGNSKDLRLGSLQLGEFL